MQTHRSARQTRGVTAKIIRINPGELHETPGYHHVTIVESARMAFLAGQFTGQLVEVDLTAALPE